MTSRALFHYLTPLSLALVTAAGAATYLLGREMAGGWVDVATLIHVMGGIVVSLPGFALCWRWLRTGRAERPLPLLRMAGGAGILAIGSGLLLVATAAAGHSIRRVDPTFHVHCLAGFGALLLLCAHAAHRMPGPATAAAGLAFSGLFLAGFTYLPGRYFRMATATHPSHAATPLYPAGVIERRAGNWSEDGATCGKPGCHPAQLRDWSASAHARGQLEGLYRAAVGRLRSDDTTRRFCAGCHAPASLLSRGADEHSGVTCLGCHAGVRVEAPVGNGLASYAAPRSGRLLRRTLGEGLAVRLRPAPHRADTAVSRDGPASACVPCHRLSVSAGLNGYGFARYDETWRQWLVSPHAGLSAYAAQDARQKRDCVDCHPPHRASSIQPAPPYAVEVMALRFGAEGQGAIERIEAPLATRSPLLQPGAEVAVDVLVRTRNVGHAMPTGSPHLRDMRLRLTVSDLEGTVLLAGGGAPGTSAEEHTYGLVALDRGGRRVEGADLQRIAVSLKQVGRDAPRLIPAEGGDVARYRFQVPRAPAGGGIRIRAVLERGDLTSVASAELGVRAPLRRPVAQHAVDLRVAGAPGPYRGQPAAPTAEPEPSRFLAYGLALLAQGDRQRARGVLRMASAAEPARTEITVALGRTYLAEGDLLAARELFETAVSKGSVSGRAWLASTLRRMGQFQAAVRLLEPLARQWPHDPQIRFELGRCRYQLGDYEGAARAFEEMLAIDPVDSAGHYHLMLSNRRLRRTTAALREEAIYQALRDDPPPTELVEPFLREHPGVRRELLPMHEHRLAPVRRN